MAVIADVLPSSSSAIRRSTFLCALRNVSAVRVWAVSRALSPPNIRFVSMLCVLESGGDDEQDQPGRVGGAIMITLPWGVCSGQTTPRASGPSVPNGSEAWLVPRLRESCCLEGRRGLGTRGNAFVAVQHGTSAIGQLLTLTARVVEWAGGQKAALPGWPVRVVGILYTARGGLEDERRVTTRAGVAAKSLDPALGGPLSHEVEPFTHSTKRRNCWSRRAGRRRLLLE
jgi:hypothetical protein